MVLNYHVMKKTITIFSFLFPVWLSAQTHIGFKTPPVSASLFNEVNINTGLRERDFALSPDGREIFYTLQSPQGNFQTILYLKKDGKGKWSKPEVAPFAGIYSDLEPAFTADGKKLFFASNRPLTGNAIKDFDIWCVEKKDNKWSEPKNLGEPVNTTADEYYPSIALSGNLYFTAAYKNAVGKEDIYLSVFENGKYLTPVPLDTAVNSTTFEFNAFVSPDEQFIIFTSYGRVDDKGRGDLYLSTRNAMGKWMPARNLVSINSEKMDYCPFVSFDKKNLFFTSERHALKGSFPDRPVGFEELVESYSAPLNGGGNIYWISFDVVMKSLQY
jgi:WD40-like Beta Propeller Repeat